MYKVRNKIYADAGKILVGEGKRGYSFLGELNEFSEKDVFIDDMKVDGRFIIYSGGEIMEQYDPNATYEQLKTKYIKILFDNDSQIAIMFNKGASEEDDLLFDKMQEWREWSGILAKKVSSISKSSKD